MRWIQILSNRWPLFIAAILLAGCAAMGTGDGVQVTMTGAEEVPPVTTAASGTGVLRVAEDMSVSGRFKLQNAAQILVAHIHVGAAGATGPVIIPLRKIADNEWEVPPGAKLTESQYQSYKAGGLYVNFHSAKYKGGEIRGQIRPSGGGRSGY
ncbi:MAG: CHRD domain-containing protein [Betaproteobacteria bacterium]|nr:CHRD domain-containing protein [Betaproteobacteria bacterium]